MEENFLTTLAIIIVLFIINNHVAENVNNKMDLKAIVTYCQLEGS